MLRSATEKLHLFLQRRRVGYFSMEIALRSEIPTYAGGLGVLAGDTLRSCADLGLAVCAVTLAHRDPVLAQVQHLAHVRPRLRDPRHARRVPTQEDVLADRPAPQPRDRLARLFTHHRPLLRPES